MNCVITHTAAQKFVKKRNQIKCILNCPLGTTQTREERRPTKSQRDSQRYLARLRDTSPSRSSTWPQGRDSIERKNWRDFGLVTRIEIRFWSWDESKTPIFEHFLSAGNLKPKLKIVFKPKLRPKFFYWIGPQSWTSCWKTLKNSGHLSVRPRKRSGRRQRRFLG